MIEKRLQAMANTYQKRGMPLVASCALDALEAIRDLKAELDDYENYSATCPECGKYIS